jgi:hypothetical protein
MELQEVTFSSAVMLQMGHSTFHFKLARQLEILFLGVQNK